MCLHIKKGRIVSDDIVLGCRWLWSSVSY